MFLFISFNGFSGVFMHMWSSVPLSGLLLHIDIYIIFFSRTVVASLLHLQLALGGHVTGVVQF